MMIIWFVIMMMWMTIWFVMITKGKPRSLQVDAYSLEENEFYVDRDPGDDFIDL